MIATTDSPTYRRGVYPPPRLPPAIPLRPFDADGPGRPPLPDATGCLGCAAGTVAWAVVFFLMAVGVYHLVEVYHR